MDEGELEKNREFSVPKSPFLDIYNTKGFYLNTLGNDRGVTLMYYYRSLKYALAPGERCCFLGANVGMEHDPYFSWKVSRPIHNADDRIMFLNPARLRVCNHLFSILAYFAKEFIAKASLLIDYDHFECTLQLSCLHFVNFYDLEESLFWFVLFCTEDIHIDAMANGAFAFTMEFPLFEPLSPPNE